MKADKTKGAEAPLLVLKGLTAFRKYGFTPVIRDVAKRISRRGFRTFVQEVSSGPAAERPPSNRNDYQSWIRRYDTVNKPLRDKLLSTIAAFPVKPVVSIITTRQGGWSPDALEAMARTAIRQLYPCWELLVVDKPKADSTLRQRMQKAAGGDVRVNAWMGRIP